MAMTPEHEAEHASTAQHGLYAPSRLPGPARLGEHDAPRHLKALADKQLILSAAGGGPLLDVSPQPHDIVMLTR